MDMNYYETHQLTSLEDYEPYVGRDAICRIREKAKRLSHLHVAHVNSTYYGGGVAELLSSLTLLMNQAGIKTGWRVLQGSPDFFGITKKFHNALQGGECHLTDRKKKIYENIIYENAIRNHLDHDMVVIHDPQPLYMIKEYQKKGPWIWRCHLDFSRPNSGVWEYLSQVIERYDAVIMSIKEYRRKLQTPQLFFMPAIDPFCIKNRHLEETEIQERLAHHDIPVDKPLIVQIGRFDRWKDPAGVIEAFRIAQKDIDARLVLLGNIATDDPEGEEVYHSLLKHHDDDVRILSQQDTALVNALQSQAAVVLQKSLREGFGLTVAEAMWKGTPVIGGNVGGIRYQIRDGVNGFLVSSIEETAGRMVQLIKNPRQRDEMGQRAKKDVTERLLLTRLLEQYLDLFSAFETIYRLRDHENLSR